MPAGAMEAAGWYEHDVAGVGGKQTDLLDLVVAFAFQNEPELLVADMEMAAIAGRRGRHAGTADDVDQIGLV